MLLGYDIFVYNFRYFLYTYLISGVEISNFGVRCITRIRTHIKVRADFVGTNLVYQIQRANAIPLL